MRIISLVNQKGGVGKTTSSVNIAAMLGKKNKKTLLIDLDPQANATSGLGLYENNFTHSVYEAMLGNIDPNLAVYPTAVSNLSIMPSTKDLAGAEIELVSEFNRERFLKNMIDKINADFEIIIIDCPPSLGLLTINALTASTEVIIPVQCEYFALRGFKLLKEITSKIQERLNPDLAIIGIVATMFEKTAHSKEVLARIYEAFPNLLFDTVISKTVRFNETTAAGEPITSYASSSPGATAYRRLAREVIARGGSR